jgi:hypothetical protein
VEPPDRHPQVTTLEAHNDITVDEGIVHLVRWARRAGWRTHASCQEGGDRAYIGFVDAASLDLFLTGLDTELLWAGEQEIRARMLKAPWLVARSPAEVDRISEGAWTYAVQPRPAEDVLRYPEPAAPGPGPLVCTYVYLPVDDLARLETLLAP